MRPSDTPAAAMRRQLIAVGKARGDEFYAVLERFARTRWAFRLGLHAQRRQVMVKGASLLPLWVGDAARPTQGLDLLVTQKMDEATLRAWVLEVGATEAPDDGLEFSADSLLVEPQRTASGYSFTRFTLQAILGAVQTPLHLGVAVDPVQGPPPEEVELPSPVEALPAAKVRALTKEGFLAEKLHMCMGLGFEHQRMQDLYDMYALIQNTALSGSRLSAAIRTTLDRRISHLPTEDLPPFLTPDYVRGNLRAAEWQNFARKLKLAPPLSLPELMSALQMFFITPLETLAKNRAFTANWSGSGLWE